MFKQVLRIVLVLAIWVAGLWAGHSSYSVAHAAQAGELGPHYWRVSVSYADGAVFNYSDVTELAIDTEAGEIVIRFDEPDAAGYYGMVLDLAGAAVSLEEDLQHGR